MWHTDFADRLEAWAILREKAQSLPLDEALQTINDWWFDAPWKSYYLHWDDQPTWPNPWQLLNDNIFCELARGLGILYTITLLEHKDLKSAKLVLTEDEHNLVLVNKEKYTLNWDHKVIVNTPLSSKIKRSFIHEQIK